MGLVVFSCRSVKIDLFVRTKASEAIRTLAPFELGVEVGSKGPNETDVAGLADSSSFVPLGFPFLGGCTR